MKIVDINLNASLLFLEEEFIEIENLIKQATTDYNLTVKQQEDFYYHYVINLIIDLKIQYQKNLVICIKEQYYNQNKKVLNRLEKLIKISFIPYLNKDQFLKQEETLFYINIISKLNKQSDINSTEKLQELLDKKSLKKLQPKFAKIKTQIF